MLAMEVDMISERGGRRYNEDACGHLPSDTGLCCVLADGAGGHGGGDVAARQVVKELLLAFAERPQRSGADMAASIHKANDVLIASRAPGPTQDMHTTVVCLVIDAIDQRAHWGHAGDSRLYWFRDGKILWRTRDHTVVQSLADAGLWKLDALKEHPQGNELVSALGMPSDALTISISEEPSLVEAGDVFLLCSDGCWEYLDDAALLHSLATASTPKAWLNDLAAQITAAPLDNKSKSHDNFTAMAVWVSAMPVVQGMAAATEGA